MKWLRQILEILMAERAKSQQEPENEKLNVLIKKHEELIPSVQKTSVMVDLYWKCYAYGDELKPHIEFLDGIMLSSTREIAPSCVENVDELIERQEKSLVQLDTKRSVVTELIDKGKLILANPDKPKFLERHVNQIEDGWEDTKQKAKDRLKLLQDTKEAWVGYAENNEVIATEFEKAKDEIQKVKKKFNLEAAFDDLAKRQKIYNDTKTTIEGLFDQIKNNVEVMGLTIPEDKKKNVEKEKKAVEEKLAVLPDSKSTVANLVKKSPDSKSTVANLVLAVGTVFSATSPTNPEVDALWSFDSDTVENCSPIEDNPCTYNNHPLEKASTPNPLLTAKDPFLAIKSPPRTPSIDDLWSSEALFNSSESQHLADPSDPLTQFVNPLEAEGFKPDAFEKSRLRSMSKVPIEAEKSVSEKESSYQVHEEIEEKVKIEKDNSDLPSEKEVVTERSAAEPTEGILKEFKSEPESSSQEELSTIEEKINLTPEADIVKAEFICANEMAPCLPIAPQSHPQDPDMDLMEYILNDDIQPDQEFVQSAEQTLQQMQIQTIELSDIYEDSNIQNINQT